VLGVAVGSGSEILTDRFEGGAQAWSPSDGYTTPSTIDPKGGYAVGVDLSTGDVIADEVNSIGEYEASSEVLLGFGAGLLEASAGVAVDDATDTVYATDYEKGLVYVFGKPLLLAQAITATPATGITGTTASVSGSVNPEGTVVTSCRFEYGLSTSYGVRVPCSQAPPLTGSVAIAEAAQLGGLQPGKIYHYRLVATNEAGQGYGEDQTLQTLAATPSLDDVSASGVTQTSAILNASINPNNQDTTYHFEFGATTAYGTTLPARDVDLGSGYGDAVVAQQLTGLTPGTTYYFRVIATNATSAPGGTIGPAETFTTPPSQPPLVDTGQADGVAQSSATLTATVDTQGFQTAYEFDVGTDTSYGTRIFADAGSEAGTQTVTFHLQDLAPATTYHYRIAATNIFGTVDGTDETFTTDAYPSSVLLAPVVAPLVPTPLLAPAPKPSAAKAASGGSVAHASRCSKARRCHRKRTRARSKRKNGAAATRQAHNADGRGRS
jgi:hypothetical protein